MQWLGALGGLGVFLLGMVVMTQGLRAVAGGALPRILLRFTSSPLRGAATGAVATAVLQSSSATTVATVGFVSAGVMSFAQALGVLFGANVGTTITGWMVTLLGFKLQLGAMAQPLLLIGVLLHLFGRGRWRQLGWAVAGFALLFLGIDLLKDGMAGFQDLLRPESFPQDTFGGRGLLVLLGIAITLVTQSSSAGVAMALVAVHEGAISFPQATALVVGMDVGTTATTALATLGGSCAMRRTGYSHVIYNLMTGLGAYLALPLYGAMAERVWDLTRPESAQVALVAFHTTLNAIGLAVVLPLTGQFTRLMQWLVPEDPRPWTQMLDRKLLTEPEVSTRALLRATRNLAAAQFRELSAELSGERTGEGSAAWSEALAEAMSYARLVLTEESDARSTRRHLDALHALEHLERLHRRAERLSSETTAQGAELRDESLHLAAALRVAAAGLEAEPPALTSVALQESSDRLRALRDPFRHRTLLEVSRHRATLEEAIESLRQVRWLHRTADHCWRIVRHLSTAEDGGVVESVSDSPGDAVDDSEPG